MTEYEYGFDELPSRCPKCGSDNINGTENNWVTASVEEKGYICNGCSFQWLETWRFHNWEVKD
jgi:hypothetical protein